MSKIESLYKQIGTKIRELRNSKNLTIAQLAEIAEIDDYYLGEIERAEKRASLETLLKLSIALEIEIHELIKFD